MVVDTGIQPVCCHASPTPYRQRNDIDRELDIMEKAGIIEKATGPTTWCARIVAVKKANGETRICSDGRPLKQALFREKHPPVTLADIRYKMNGSKFFSKIDMRAGYYQIKLSEASRPLTTFATHRGLYRYLRLNMGISCSSEIFQREIRNILFDIDGKTEKK